jgi:hypothetical protein
MWIHPGIWQHWLPTLGEGQATCNTPEGGGKVLGDFGFLPRLVAAGTTGTQMCTHSLSHLPSLTHHRQQHCGGGGGSTSQANQRETRLFRIKVQFVHWASGWDPRGHREGAESTYPRGSGSGTDIQCESERVQLFFPRGQFSVTTPAPSSLPIPPQRGSDLRQKK